MSMNHIERVLGAEVRAKHKEYFYNLDEHFKNPIIHKEIHGDKVYVPLDLNRIWGKTY